MLANITAITACSKEITIDGIARVTLKNGYPCVYLSNGKPITRIQFSQQNNASGFVPHGANGSQREQCILFNHQEGTLAYNTPLYVLLSDTQQASLTDAYLAHFCVKQKNNRLRLVNVVHTEHGRHCSEHAWKPVKEYSGLFGYIEQWIDWLLHLNGYTKEVF